LRECQFSPSQRGVNKSDGQFRSILAEFTGRAAGKRTAANSPESGMDQGQSQLTLDWLYKPIRKSKMTPSMKRLIRPEKRRSAANQVSEVGAEIRNVARC
jgi:hypothetical protein